MGQSSSFSAAKQEAREVASGTGPDNISEVVVTEVKIPMPYDSPGNNWCHELVLSMLHPCAGSIGV